MRDRRDLDDNDQLVDSPAGSGKGRYVSDEPDRYQPPLRPLGNISVELDGKLSYDP